MPARPTDQPTPSRTVKNGGVTKRTKPVAPSRIVILAPEPVLDGGRYAPKRTVGESVDVRATIFADGHDVLRAVVKVKAPQSRKWRETPLVHVDKDVDGDTFEGSFAVDALGRWEWTIEAWIDRFASWREELRRKVQGGQHDLAGELSEGVVLLEAAAQRAKAATDRRLIEHAIRTLTDPDAPEEAKHDAALGPELAAAIDRYPDRTESAELDAPFAVDVDRELARFGSWYELFPRSWGGFKGTAEAIPQIAALGFDVLYLTPIHPIGETNRKGTNNALTARPGDPGSPWAIGLQGRRRPRGRPSRPGHAGGLRGARAHGDRARHRHRDRLRDPVLGRSPVADRAPRVVPPPPGRLAEVRREPAQEVPGHLQRQLPVRGLEVLVERVVGHRAHLGRSRRQGLPRRQPAHQAAGLLGVDDRARSAPSTPT